MDEEDKFRELLYDKLKGGFDKSVSVDICSCIFRTKKDSKYDITIKARSVKDPRLANTKLDDYPLLVEIDIDYNKTKFSFYANERLEYAKLRQKMFEIGRKLQNADAVEYIDMLIVEILSAYVEATSAIETKNRIENN